MELVHGDLRTAAPAASKERSLWLLEDLVPGAGVNNLTFTFQAEGPLDGDALQRSLTFLVGRHETLRTVFHTDGETSALRKSVLPADEAEVTVEHHRSEPGTDTLAPSPSTWAPPSPPTAARCCAPGTSPIPAVTSSA